MKQSQMVASNVAQHPRRRSVPACKLSRRVIAAMVAAGATKDELEEEDLRVVRIPSLNSDAWQVYVDWACSLGEVYPLVQAVFAPPLEISDTLMTPRNTIAFDIQQEPTKLIYHMASLTVADLAGGEICWPPLSSSPSCRVVVRDAAIAVSAVPEALSHPEPLFPVVHALHVGQYICHLQYTWFNACITVPVFRA